MAHPDLSFAHKMAGGSCLEGPGECVASGSLQQPGECVFVDGPAQKITLHFMALIFTQETEFTYFAGNYWIQEFKLRTFARF